MFTNHDTFLPLEELGKASRPYLPTHAFGGPFINESHRFYSTCPSKDGMLIDVGVVGWLLRADALKLYELAYFAPGDILEIGCSHGLSTSIIARAVIDSGLPRRIDTIDLDPTCVTRELAGAGRTFAFVFIDHHHSYRPVFDVCVELASLTAPGALCLFHDYNDPRNADPANEDFGVYQAVQEGLPAADFEFHGIFGCTGLYRRRGTDPIGSLPDALRDHQR
jgi:hypothetical protein